MKTIQSENLERTQDFISPTNYELHLYLWPGQSLISGFVLQSSSRFSFLISELSVVGQDLGVGLQYVVENVEAVCATDLWALLQRTHLWVVKVLVGTHNS